MGKKQKRRRRLRKFWDWLVRVVTGIDRELEEP